MKAPAVERSGSRKKPEGRACASPPLTFSAAATVTGTDLFKQGEHDIDRDQVYDELKKHSSDEELIELGLLCGMTDGVGKLVKSFNVLSWKDACDLNPELTQRMKAQAAE